MLLSAIILLLTGSVAEAQTEIRMLSIGNSFSEDAIEQNLYELAHEAGFEQWHNNMQELISKARADGKVPVVMNNKWQQYAMANY